MKKKMVSVEYTETELSHPIAIMAPRMGTILHESVVIGTVSINDGGDYTVRLNDYGRKLMEDASV